MTESTNNDTYFSGVWSERVLVVTQDYEIRGYVFMPKTGKKNRVLSDILNGNKRFVAIKDCEIVHRNNASRKSEKQNFIQLNLNSIILLRPEKLPEKAPIKKAKASK
ncbi:hypothetical protein IJE86_00510 [bacterium]|nr:hypothetical protein [bacterium]